MALAKIAQDDFGLGTLRGTARDVRPGVGVHQALNGMLNDDGDVFVRGMTTRRTSSPNVAADPLYWLWSGALGEIGYVVSGGPAGLWQMVGSDLPVISGSTGVTAPGMQTAAIGHNLYLPTLQKLTGDDATGILTCSAWTPPSELPASGTTHVATIAHRLVVARGNRVAFSAPDSEVFAPTDFHELPGGVSVMGMFAQQDTLLVFTNYGLWAISNMAYDLTDAAGNLQQPLSLIVPGLSLLGEGGLCPWRGRVVAACIDKVYLVDPFNPPVPISDSIAEIYADCVSLIQRPGGAKVFRDTLLLPIIDRFNGPPVTLLTCRLDRPVRAGHLYYPWTELAGHAARHYMLDLYYGPQGALVIGGGHDGWINDLTGAFAHDFAGADADGTVAEFVLETRDFPTGQGQPNHLKRIGVTYTAQANADVQIDIAVSTDPLHQTWVDLGSQTLPMTGVDPITHWLPQAIRARYARVRVTVQDADLASLIVHRVELQVRSAAHAR